MQLRSRLAPALASAPALLGSTAAVEATPAVTVAVNFIANSIAARAAIAASAAVDHPAPWKLDDASIVRSMARAEARLTADALIVPAAAPLPPTVVDDTSIVAAMAAAMKKNAAKHAASKAPTQKPTPKSDAAAIMAASAHEASSFQPLDSTDVPPLPVASLFAHTGFEVDAAAIAAASTGEASKTGLLEENESLRRALSDRSARGNAQMAFLSAQADNSRAMLASAVAQGSSAMMQMENEMSKLRQMGMECAIREMKKRRECSELQTSNGLWSAEVSKASAAALVSGCQANDADLVLDEIFKAETQNIFACRRGIDGFLHDVATARAGTTGTHKSTFTKAFFTKLSVKGGPALAQWVSEALGEGTAVVSEGRLRDWVRQQPQIEIGNDEHAIQFNMARAEKFYTKHAIHSSDTAYVVDEDATAHAKHIEVCLHNGRIRAYGFNGGPYYVENKQELLELLTRHGLSSTTYVHLLVPQKRNTPTFPIVVSESNNKFDTAHVGQVQKRILRVFLKTFRCNNLHCFDSDGDSRLRKRYLQMQFNWAYSEHDLFLTLEHDMIRVRVPFITGYGYVFFDQCDMHIAWRFAIQYLKLKKGNSHQFMRLGPLRYQPSAFQHAATSMTLPPKQRLTASAFKVHDKQNELGCRAKGGLDKSGKRKPDAENYLRTLWDDPKQLHLRPDILYHMVLGEYISLHTDKSLSVMERMYSVGFVLEWISLSYELAVETEDTSPKADWLTRETATDMIVGLMLKPLLIKYYRETGHKAEPTFERIASKMLEFFFQQVRSYDRNSSKFTFFQVC